jgi:hypothetical protein
MLKMHAILAEIACLGEKICAYHIFGDRSPKYLTALTNAS